MSADGNWRWNSQQWIPANASRILAGFLVPTVPPHRPLMRCLWKGAAWSCFLICTVLLGASCSSSSNDANQKVAPTSIVSQRQQAARYVSAILPDLAAEGDAFNEFPSTCDSSNPRSCRSGFKKIHDANAALDKVLRANEAPACLRQADSDMHVATILIDQATHDGTAGIDRNDSSLLMLANQKIQAANSHLMRAGELMQKNSC